MDKYIIKKSEIDDMKGLNKSHFLNSNAIRINKSLGDLTGITGFGFHIIEVPSQKESSELHAHQYEDECIYVLSGQATAYLGTESFAVHAGDFIGYRASGLAHKIVNTSDEVFRCIVVGQRLDHDVADYPELNKRLYRNKGQPWDLIDCSHIEHPNAGKKS